MREDDSELVEEDSREEDHGGEAGGKDEDCEQEELEGGEGGEGGEGREGEDDEKGREEGNEGGEEAGEEDERQRGDGEEDLGEEKEEEEERSIAEGHRDTNEDEAQSVEETTGAGEAHRDRRGWTGGGKEGREAERLSRGVEELSLSGGPSILFDAFLPSRFSAGSPFRCVRSRLLCLVSKGETKKDAPCLHGHGTLHLSFSVLLQARS
ncbi:hypothetical protein TGVEG_244220 [Toxoplasma gondii VEG]|uniref:Uncharacterized protein n=1 Tax=Toxoplasma gondii (strain ATCC 50861 / VEG) TaxID=432359 RepID=V4Z8J1_TOXGV|nr:hypothetical protein TGVEG_244220 [Toxoplasma gondii VEG]